MNPAPAAIHLGYIDATLKRGPYLLGDQYSAADIQMSFVGELAARLVDMNDYPNLAAWLQRLKSREPYLAALQRGDAAFS
jgi:glutathione S-transferase